MFNSNKPLKLKPNLYFSYLNILQPWAISQGYYLVAHGSMSRDMDILAMPIEDDPMEEFSFIQGVDKLLTGEVRNTPEEYYRKRHPGGRVGYFIQLGKNITVDGKVQDFYLDVKVIPLVTDN